MRIGDLLLLLSLFLCYPSATYCQDSSSAKKTITDLNRIVSPEGIQETFKERIGGIDQWVYVRGQDKSNPIILFLHGGPASPASPTTWMYQRPMEEYFTFVNYDQRAAGKTYLENKPHEPSDSLYIDQYVDDAIELTKAISKRYGVDKVILMGHSWGTIVGMKAALKRPGLYYAYVGIGQVINSRLNEQLSFKYALRKAREHENKEALKELKGISPYPGKRPITRKRVGTERTWAQYYGGLSAYRHNSTYYFKAPRLSPVYNDSAIAAIDQGSLFTLKRVLDEFMEVDFTGVKEFPIPVIMFMGRHDYTTPSAPTRKWLNNVSAPYKKGIWFENSAHLIQYEEPGKTLLSLVKYVLPLTKATQ